MNNYLINNYNTSPATEISFFNNCFVFVTKPHWHRGIERRQKIP
jgi:hypothetical protein